MDQSTSAARIIVRSLEIFLLLLALTGCTTASDTSGRAIVNNTCTDPIIRKEWRELSAKAKLEYISAVQCLINAPPQTSLSVAPGVVSRYDDFIAAHSMHMMSIHFVGQFLPYHRYFVASYEKALREECGYTGAQPYWNWSLDIASNATFVESPIFDTILGFGGNGPYTPFNTSDPDQPSAPLGDVPGRTGGGCVADGPFKNHTLTLGPGADLSGSAGPLCFRRDFSPLIAMKFGNDSDIAYTLSQPDFGWFNVVIDGNLNTILPPNFEYTSIHTGGHWSIGGSFGQITDLYISPSDPLFFLMHSNLDRAFWSWQSRDLPYRLTDISGPLVFGDYDNEVAGNTTLKYVIDVETVNVNTTVGAVMNIQGGTLCYDYNALM